MTPRGITKTLSHGYDALLARSVPSIPQLIERGIHRDSIEKQPGLMSHTFANKIRLDGQEHVVGFVLREDRIGNRFYDHELAEISSPDWLIPGHPSNEGPSSEGSYGHRAGPIGAFPPVRSKRTAFPKVVWYTPTERTGVMR